MDIRLNQDQIEIARQARRFCENETPMEYVRAMIEDERGFTKGVWSKMTEMGWTALRIPEVYGGLDMELMDLAVILEEMGRGVVPGPFFSTVLLAAEAILETGSESQKEAYLTRISEGEVIGTLALHETDGGADPGYVQMGAQSNDNGFVLEGTKLFVPDAHVADVIVCAARTSTGEDPTTGITLFLLDPKADGVSISLLPTMDGTRKLCSLELKGVQVGADGILGRPNEGWGPLQRVLQRAQVGLCAECVGGAQRAMEIATEYAKVRIQFDQPIGGFQAVKHRCAQMYVEVESSAPSYTGQPGHRIMVILMRPRWLHPLPRPTARRFTGTHRQAPYRYWVAPDFRGNMISTSI
jgi:alkylation response protein AidB-like acyl-CoA dehydrogenase